MSDVRGARAWIVGSPDRFAVLAPGSKSHPASMIDVCTTRFAAVAALGCRTSSVRRSDAGSTEAKKLIACGNG
jgi:hypothetical protein